MPEFIRKHFGERLVEEGLLTPEQYQAAMKKHAESRVILRQILVDMGLLTEDQLMEFVGKVFEIPVYKNLTEKIYDPEIVKNIPEKSCRQYCAIPVSK